MTAPLPTTHVPVLLDEVIRFLNPREGDVVVDGTLGGGGYSEALLSQTPARCIGLDRDPEALARTRGLAGRFPGRFQAVHSSFADLEHVLDQMNIAAIQGFVVDLGLCSDQLADGARGFSFMQDGPLDMRMDPCAPRTAADIVNTEPEGALADLIHTLGEEPKARRIARALVAERAREPFTRTLTLARVVERAVRSSGAAGSSRIHPATRTFQALRMAVNDETGHLERGLHAALGRLAEGGRLVAVSFHSLEDRIVKHTLRNLSPVDQGRLLPGEQPPAAPPFLMVPLASRAVRPSPGEVARNPRARSARLRAAFKTTHTGRQA